MKINGHSGRESIKTQMKDGYVGVVEVDGLLPGTYFAYDIFINGKKYEDENREFGFRTFPEPTEGAKFTIAFGGCSGFVPEYESVWERIADHDPRAMLMLGDNVYIDDPENVKWTGDYCYSRRHSRPEWKKLVAKTSMHAIYDDHDFGMDDCVPGAQVDLPLWKKPVLQNFINNWNNPSVGGGERIPVVGRLFLWDRCSSSCWTADITETEKRNPCLELFKSNGSRILSKIQKPLLKSLLHPYLFPKVLSLEAKIHGTDTRKSGGDFQFY